MSKARILKFILKSGKNAASRIRVKKQRDATRKWLKDNPDGVTKLEQKPAPKLKKIQRPKLPKKPIEEDTQTAQYQSAYADDAPPMENFDTSPDFDTQMALDEESASRIRSDTSPDIKGTTYGLDKFTTKRIKTEVSESSKHSANKRLPTEHKFAVRSDKPKKISTKTKVLKLKVKKK